jgi:hypothetical protein
MIGTDVLQPWFVFGAFMCLVVSKMLVNQIQLVRTRQYLRHYENYLDNPENQKLGWDFVEKTPEIASLFRSIRMDEPRFTAFRPAPQGFMHSSAKVWNNIHLRQPDVIESVYLSFHLCIGYFRARRNEALDPFYWIKVIIFLPSQIIEAGGGSSDSLGAKLAQGAYWLLGFIKLAIEVFST